MTIMTGIYTDAAGNSREVPLAVDATGKLLIVSIGIATLRTINRATLLNNSNNLQAEFQAAYDGEAGNSAPDAPVPTAVVNAANALNNSNYKIYLGHTTWYYTNATNTVTSTNWTPFGGGKSNFAAAIPANHIFTFK
jgi:hypothetical protein